MNAGCSSVRPRSPELFLTAQWRSLLMINYAVDPSLLQQFIPRGTELDLWEDTALVSMVGFLFLDTRVRKIGFPFHRDFEEVNLRFYVRRKSPEGWRRGVVFVKEIVPRVAIALIARVLYNENYAAARMRSRVEFSSSDIGSLEYGWYASGRWNSLSARVQGEPQVLAAGSLGDFLFEHYYGYTRQRDGGTVEYEVRHPKWRAWSALEPRLDCDVARVYGSQFVASLSATPHSAFVAEGSEVEVYGGVRLPRLSAGSA